MTLIDPELTGGIKIAARGDYRAHKASYDSVQKVPVFSGAKYPWRADRMGKRKSA